MSLTDSLPNHFTGARRLTLTMLTARDRADDFKGLPVGTAKPLRLQVVKVAPGETVDKLASRMAVSDRAAERFRVLNGLDPSDRLKPGSEVKIVVE